MKAIEFDRYGQIGSLKILEVDKPKVGEGQVLIKIMACALNRADMIMFTGKPFMARFDGMALRKPKYPRLGSAVAGQVVALGQGVKHLEIGDAVVGDLSSEGFGGLADYVAISEKHLALKAPSVPYEEAVASPMAAVVALQAVRKANLEKGQDVLVYGASGGVGSYAIQIAKLFGGRLTAACSSRHIEQAKSLGADEVLDYAQIEAKSLEGRFDVILGVNGYQSLKTYKRWLKETGKYVMVGGQMKQILAAEIMGKAYSKGTKELMSLGSATPNSQDIKQVMEWLEEGEITCPIEVTYDFKEVQEAFERYLKGHARGKVVLVNSEQLGGIDHDASS
jgi:NADPH:quinone reductase-like Zn-dependent oxidoreductase